MQPQAARVSTVTTTTLEQPDSLLDAVLAETALARFDTPAINDMATLQTAAPVVTAGGSDLSGLSWVPKADPAPSTQPATYQKPAVPVFGGVTSGAGAVAAGALAVTPKQWAYIKHLRTQCRSRGHRNLAGREIANDRKGASAYITEMTETLKNGYYASKPVNGPKRRVCSVCWCDGCTIGPMADA